MTTEWMDASKHQCDSGCGKPASRWFGMTSFLICDDPECFRVQQEAYEERCREVAKQNGEPQWNG